ncbi:MAG: hypothetical protein R3A52_25135 [Polyangiales bacterium]
MEPWSVRAVIEQVDELVGQDITVLGQLFFGEDGPFLGHVPGGEGRAGASCIRLSVGDGSLDFDPRRCEQLSGRRVLVEGTPARSTAAHWSVTLRARTLEPARPPPGLR